MKGEEGFQLTFKHHFTKKKKVFFSFSYPWTTIDSDNLVKNLIDKKFPECFTKYEDLTLTSCKRPVKILTVTKL